MIKTLGRLSKDAVVSFSCCPSVLKEMKFPEDMHCASLRDRGRYRWPFRKGMAGTRDFSTFTFST